MLRAFLYQPSRAYRDFQIVLGLLAVHFALPALSYAFAPERPIAQLVWLDTLLGGAGWDFPEAGSRVWRNLAAANVMTLALLCVLLMRDIRASRHLLLPLVFLKGSNALLFCIDFFVVGAPAFLAIGLWDLSNCWMFVFFTRRALRDLEGRDDAVLVPRPAGASR